MLEWVDRMIRTTNPFPERLAFFFHRHFANGRDGGPVAADAAASRPTCSGTYSDFAREPERELPRPRR